MLTLAKFYFISFIQYDFKKVFSSEFTAKVFVQE